MYHTLKEFLDDWKYESDSTIKILSNLTDETLNHKLSAKGRTLGRLAWHITAQIGEALNGIGVKFEAVNDDENYPSHVKTIVEMLGHHEIDILKMDIEGAEYEVIDDLLDEPIDRIQQILIEFHHWIYPSISLKATSNAISKLENEGYKLYNISKKGVEFSFIHP